MKKILKYRTDFTSQSLRVTDSSVAKSEEFKLIHDTGI